MSCPMAVQLDEIWPQVVLMVASASSGYLDLLSE